MSAYAVGYIREITLGSDIVRYLERIDETLAPYDGRYIVHGGSVEVLEGAWRGDLIIIEFPDLEQAHRWYASPAYQAILGLRTNNAETDVILVEGVSTAHRATDVLVQ